MSLLSLLLEARDASDTPVFGSRTPTSLTYATGSIFAAEDIVVADNYGSAILWTNTDPVTTFAFGVIIADVDIYVELKTSHGTPQFSLVKLPAGIPYFFGPVAAGSTTEKLDGALLVSNTDYATIARIEVQNNVADLVGDATVSLYLFK